VNAILRDRRERSNAGAVDATIERSTKSLGWLYFFLADIQTGVGPFLAAYLAANGWNPRSTGIALTMGGLVTVVLSPAAGAVVDSSRRKRTLVATATAALAVGAVLISLGTRRWLIGPAQVLIGGAGAVLAPALAAITLGMVGRDRFDRQFGKNQAFNSAGNVFTALLLAAVSLLMGLRSLFVAASLLAIPVWMMLARIDPRTIDDRRARAAAEEDGEATGTLTKLVKLCADRPLLTFLMCAFLFHLANAAMLPQLGEMLAKGNRRAAAPFMSACIIVTQVVIACTAAWIGRAAGRFGRKPLLLAGYGVLPVRGVLYAMTHVPAALVAIQVLDGVANAIFGVVSVLVVADRMRGTGHFNLAQGALATCVGLGAALSTTLGGVLVKRFSYGASFIGLGAVAAIAFVLLLVGVPETLPQSGDAPPPADCEGTEFAAQR
jgi:predicted MFS family arabinose efflux permease